MAAKWLLGFKRREIQVGDKTEIKSYKNTCANTVLGTLDTMLGYAAEPELIKTNPCARVRRLKNDRKKIEIITVEETRRLFPKSWRTVWGDKETAYVANRLASLTGMRAGEIMGLRGEYVFDDYIYVCGSYGEYGYGPTKTKETRFIPLTPEMIGLLKKLMERNGKGYVFSLDGGGKPVCRKYFYDEFHRALKRIGIDQDEITRRGFYHAGAELIPILADELIHFRDWPSAASHPVRLFRAASVRCRRRPRRLFLPLVGADYGASPCGLVPLEPGAGCQSAGVPCP